MSDYKNILNLVMIYTTFIDKLTILQGQINIKHCYIIIIRKILETFVDIVACANEIAAMICDVTVNFPQFTAN